jgi:hypothetical protein
MITPEIPQFYLPLPTYLPAPTPDDDSLLSVADEHEGRFRSSTLTTLI